MPGKLTDGGIMSGEKRTIDGTRLYSLRMQMGISLRQAAALLGISKSTLCRYESRKELRIDQSRIDDICRIYRVGPDALLTEKRAEEHPAKLASEEVAAYYGQLDERTQARISRILLRALD